MTSLAVQWLNFAFQCREFGFDPGHREPTAPCLAAKKKQKNLKHKNRSDVTKSIKTLMVCVKRKNLKKK